MKPFTICIPYSRTITWLQILLCSLAENTVFDDIEDIYILNNGPEVDDSLLLTWELGYYEKCKCRGLRPPPEFRSHAGCMDWVLKHISTPYFMMLESDCRVFKKDWLKNFLDPISKDNLVAMAGWYWSVPVGDRNYIGPGATIYNTEIVKKIESEVRHNKSLTFCYGDGLKKRYKIIGRSQEMIEEYKLGPFSEFRGFHDIWLDYDEKWWMEPCAWLYYRCRSQYECVELPAVYEEHLEKGVMVADGTHYGHPDTYLTHYWGGTVSYDWQKHPVTAEWQLRVLPFWIDRERKIWEEVVPAEIRKKTEEMGLIFSKDYILNHPNVHSNTRKE